MSVQKKTSSSRSRLTENIEKILITLIFVVVIISYFGTGNKELKSEFFLILAILKFFLIGYYISITRNLYSLVFIGFLIFILGNLFSILHWPFANELQLTGLFTQFIFGLFLIVKTIKDSIANKDLEIFSSLLSLALLYPVIHHFFLNTRVEFFMVYNFTTAFLLATIMYNENLWDKYNFSEKKILTYILVTVLIQVLIFSIKAL